MFHYLALVTVLYHQAADDNRLEFYKCTDKGKVVGFEENDENGTHYIVYQIQLECGQTIDVNFEDLKARNGSK